ncbi:unnamed protein product [Spodoptera littoralis]|uniref:protein-tyrosine-phosphatase n=1 Tax=Spodoptera littoralis TaxID=7109 RepID=A0A9P0I305_SPOLI|nr:unnamed protein product [Spodoptera littoralis]CAH1638851.1 unnamed protein product [Spodoptera littoralis]
MQNRPSAHAATLMQQGPDTQQTTRTTLDICFTPPRSILGMRRVAPQFSIPPPPKSEVMLGGNLTLKCVAFGSPMPTVKWRKGLTKWLTPEDNPPLGLNTLKLEDIRESANYTCEAASVLGVIEAVAEVKVQSLPGPPTEVRPSEITATTVRLTWTYSGPEEPQYYVIQYKPKYANQAFSEISGVITQYYSVTNLSPYTEYEMYVIAVNNIGRGPPSAPAVITTGETERGNQKRKQMVPIMVTECNVTQESQNSSDKMNTINNMFYRAPPLKIIISSTVTYDERDL